MEVFEMTNLRVLNLHQNNITEIPPEIGNLVNLEKLILSSNHIIHISEEIGYLKKLKKLSLKANKITSLPHSIGDLESLEILRIGFNSLSTLPDEICNLTELSQLYSEYNKLTELPDSIGKLKLTDLYINRNLINEIPLSFYSMSSLNRVNFTNAGPLFKLTNNICKMRFLETMYIDQVSLNYSPRCLEIRARSNPRFTIIISN